MYTKRIISALLTLLMLLGSLAVAVDAAWADKVDEEGDPIINYLGQAYSSPEDKLADMKMVKEQNGYQLWFEEFTGEVAWRNTETGQTLFSNPWDVASNYQTVSDPTKQKLLSQLIITYLDNNVTKTMNSYTEAALRGQITLKNIKNGIRVEYTLGEEAVTRLVPRMIRKDRFEDLILANIDSEWEWQKVWSYYSLKDKDDPDLTEKGIAVMMAQFPITQTMPVYVCATDITARELREVEGFIKQFCPNYTYEELDYDHELTGYTGNDAAPPRFRMSLEYVMNEDGLEVRLPANGIEFDSSAYQFQTVTMLPYWGAGSNEYTGYTVVPDGSGTLIRFEDFIGKSVNISGTIYGSDYAYHEITGQHAEVMRMPYYGIVTNYNKKYPVTVPKVTEEKSDEPEYDENGELIEKKEKEPDPVTEAALAAIEKPDGIYCNNGFLAIITEGDSLASLMAECGGTLHPYNTVYASFTPRPSDEYNLADSISVSGNATWTVTSDRRYTGSYKIQYIMLTDEKIAEEKGIDDYYKAEWTGMATAYRDYMTKRGDIAKLENTKEDIPLYIETFGSMTTTERKFSFPVSVDKPLTTFEDIKTMYEELTAFGINNINFKLTGYANGGLYPTVPYKLSWSDVVGGDDGFADIASYAAENGFSIYPDFDFAYAFSDNIGDGFSMTNHAVRTIDNRYTTKRTYDPAMQAFDTNGGVAISASVFEYLYDKFGPSYKEYGNSAISVGTLGTDLNSDFDEDEPYHREDSKEFTIELLERLDDDYDSIMIEGGNAYAIKYADVILNASLSSSSYVKASESIPFLGMVYHGSKVFTGSATNMEGDINEAILRAIENGASMYFTLSYRNTSLLKDDFLLRKYYSVAYDIWKDDLVKYYTILNDALRDLQTSYIIDHEFLEASRIPDADEVEADRLAAEKAVADAKAAADAAREKEERAKRLAERLARQQGTAVETTDYDVDYSEGEDILTEDTIDEDEITEFVLDKYKTESGTVVRVEYEGGVNFILNYNSFDVTVEYDGVTYDIDSLNFVRID